MLEVQMIDLTLFYFIFHFHFKISLILFLNFFSLFFILDLDRRYDIISHDHITQRRM